MHRRVEFGDDKGVGVGCDVFVYLNTVFGSQLFASIVTDSSFWKGWKGSGTFTNTGPSF